MQLSWLIGVTRPLFCSSVAVLLQLRRNLVLANRLWLLVNFALMSEMLRSSLRVLNYKLLMADSVTHSVMVEKSLVVCDTVSFIQMNFCMSQLLCRWSERKVLTTRCRGCGETLASQKLRWRLLEEYATVVLQDCQVWTIPVTTMISFFSLRYFLAFEASPSLVMMLASVDILRASLTVVSRLAINAVLSDSLVHHPRDYLIEVTLVRQDHAALISWVALNSRNRGNISRAGSH